MLRSTAVSPDLCPGHDPNRPADFACPGPCAADLPEICDAIQAHRRLRIFYDGSFRVVEPHFYGLNLQGEQVLVAYQVSSGGVTADRGWYTFKVDEISGLMETGNEFLRPRPAYDSRDRRMQGHFAKL